jgi:hypothetical protein
LKIYSLNAKKKLVKLKNLVYAITIKDLENFDEEYYMHILTKNNIKTKYPLRHYIIKGAYMGFEPNTSFNTLRYLLNNKEIIISGENPLIHFKKKEKEVAN